MADYFQLANYEIQDTGDGNILILVAGPRNYYHILRDAFSSYRFSRVFDDNRRRFSWGCYIYDVSEKTYTEIEKLLKLFQSAVCIDDALHQTFALDYHSYPSFDRIDRTELGDIVYNAKPYRHKPTQNHRENAYKLIERLEDFVSCHSGYAKSDFLIAVPCDPNKSFDLPQFIVEHLCQRLEIPSGQDFVLKVRNHEPMKDLQTLREKANNIHGVFKVLDNAPFQSKIVTIIDDIYHSGMTLHELANVLQPLGARVQGLVITKTLSNPS